MSKVLINIAGRRFGMLTVLHRAAGRSQNKSSLWLCRCDCGREHVAVSCNLRNGYTKSCGCLRSKTFINNLRAGRERANAKRARSQVVVDIGPDLAPLLEAARRAWGERVMREAGE